jgi:hypothetical protein
VEVCLRIFQGQCSQYSDSIFVSLQTSLVIESEIILPCQMFKTESADRILRYVPILYKVNTYEKIGKFNLSLI